MTLPYLSYLITLKRSGKGEENVRIRHLHFITLLMIRNQPKKPIRTP